MLTSGPLYWETRAMAAAIELPEAAEPRMRAYLLTVAANAMEEVRAYRRIAVRRDAMMEGRDG